MLKAGASPEFTSAFAAAYWTQCFLSVSNYRLNQGSDFTAVLDSYLLHPVFRFPQTGVELWDGFTSYFGASEMTCHRGHTGPLFVFPG